MLILVLWMSVGLVALALYFADTMTLELRASANRAAGLAAEQAIEGASRYVAWSILNLSTNGVIPTNSLFRCESLPIGEARVWIIGRDTPPTLNVTATQPVFGLVDEAGKLNINRAGSNILVYLPGMFVDVAQAVVDWRSTNSTLTLNYGALGYEAKHGQYESLDELRLVQGITLADLEGDDRNRNGVQDAQEKAASGAKPFHPGLLDYLTVYSREPNTHSDGTTLTNIGNRAQLLGLLGTAFGQARAQQVLNQLGFRGNATPTIASPLQFYLNSGLGEDDFARIAGELATSTNSFTYGRVNVNTAPEPVLTALFMGSGVNEQTATGAAETLINYRRSNPDSLGSVAWIVTALGRNSPVVTALAQRDRITTRSFQYSADIAAVGPEGRGYRRVRFVFDLSDGTPKIIHRQDLSRLGWALGDTVREKLLAGNTP